VKKYSTSLIGEEIQIKTTVKNNFTPTRMGKIIKKKKDR
jgi:hypothetical protein